MIDQSSNKGSFTQKNEKRKSWCKPLLYIDIDIGDGKKERISVFQGNEPKLLAQEFCKKHKFDKKTEIVLQNQI